MSEPPIVTTTVAQFKELTGLGHTSVYELIKSGDIQSVTIGRRRLIILESWFALLRSRLSADVRLNSASNDGRGDGWVDAARRNPLINM